MLWVPGVAVKGEGQFQPWEPSLTWFWMILQGLVGESLLQGQSWVSVNSGPYLTSAHSHGFSKSIPGLYQPSQDTLLHSTSFSPPKPRLLTPPSAPLQQNKPLSPRAWLAQAFLRFTQLGCPIFVLQCSAWA